MYDCHCILFKADRKLFIFYFSLRSSLTFIPCIISEIQPPSGQVMMKTKLLVLGSQSNKHPGVHQVAIRSRDMILPLTPL